MRHAGEQQVIERIDKTIWNDALADAMKQRVNDLTLQDTRMLYGPVDFGESEQMSRKRKLDVEWTDHAEYRSELRDVSPHVVNDAVTEVMRNRLMNQKSPRGKERLKVPSGTAVVDYDLRDNPAEADVVTVWGSDNGRTDMTENRVAENLARMIVGAHEWTESELTKDFMSFLEGVLPGPKGSRGPDRVRMWVKGNVRRTKDPEKLMIFEVQLVDGTRISAYKPLGMGFRRYFGQWAVEIDGKPINTQYVAWTLMERLTTRLDRYKVFVDSKDWTFEYSDDPRETQGGREHEQNMRKMYEELTPGEKALAWEYFNQNAPASYRSRSFSEFHGR
jgi:hypothetical protein